MFAIWQKILLMCVCLNSFVLFGENFIVERDFTDALTYYDKSQKTFLPVDLSGKKHDLSYLHLNVEEVSGRRLRIVSKDPFTVFLNEKLLAQYSEADTIILNLDSLQTANDPRLDFCFYVKSQEADFLKIWLIQVVNQYEVSETNNESGVGFPFLRFDYSVYYFFLIFALLMLAYLKYIKSPYLAAYFDFTRYFSRFAVDDYVVINAFNGQAFLLWAIASLLVAMGFCFHQIVGFETNSFFGIVSRIFVVFCFFFIRYF